LLAGFATIENHDPVPGVEETVIHLRTKPFPKGKQEYHGYSPPRDGNCGENSSRPLGFEVLYEINDELAPHR